MKTTIFKHKLLYFFIILGFAVIFNSCSDDDDDDFQTFLEKYDGTKWVYTEDEFTFYVRLNDNPNKFIESWILIDDCYFYSVDFESEGVELVENSKDKLIIKYTDEGEIITVTLTPQGETIRVVVKEGNDEDLYLFVKTSVNVDDLEICPV